MFGKYNLYFMKKQEKCTLFGDYVHICNMKKVVRVRIPDFEVELFRKESDAADYAGMSRYSFSRKMAKNGEVVSGGWVYIYPREV